MSEEEQHDQFAPNELEAENPEEENAADESPADRGIPSVAARPKGQVVGITLLLGFALLAIAFVIVDGMNKSRPVSVVTPEEITFRTPSGMDAPYIEPAAGDEQARIVSLSPAPADKVQDRAALQRERALQEEALRMARAQQQKMAQRLHSPQLVYDRPAARSYGANSAAQDMAAYNDHGDPNLAFAGRYQNQDFETVQARPLQNLSTLIPQGTMIAGILETAIQSDLPGMVRAVVSENVYAFDGTQLLIPKGARLIGRYRSGLIRGQSRVFIIWSRLIRNDGVSINIGSYGADDLGRSGLGGDVDTHFMERFGSSVLLSLIDTGLKIGAQSLDNNNTATLALETGSDFSNSAEIALNNSIAIPPTVHIDQGTRINVFVGKDLDFSRAGTTN